MPLSLAVGQTAVGAHVVVSNNAAAIPTNVSSVSSSDPTVATASYNMGTDAVTVNALATGTTTLTYTNPLTDPTSVSEVVTVTPLRAKPVFNDAAWVVS